VRRDDVYTGDAEGVTADGWACPGSASSYSAACHDNRASVSENLEMKWLIGFVLIVAVAVGGVYLYQQHAPADWRPGSEKVATPAKPDPEEQSTGKKVYAPIERARPKRPGVAGHSVISLHPAVARARFGMSPEAVTKIYNVVQRPTEDDTVVLVHYLRPDKMEEAKFIFVQERLKRIELVHTPRIGESLDGLHKAIRDEYRHKYGKLPNSRVNRWSDSVMEAGVNEKNGVVTLYFKSKR
jgi:hypothetical protein